MDATPVTTTATEAVRGAPSRYLLAGIALLVALTLLYLGTPRLLATALSLRYADTVRLVEQGKMPHAGFLRDALASYRDALRWHPSRALHRDTAVLYDALAKVTKDPEEARAARAAALAELRAGLAMAPLEPMLWTRLAWLLHRDNQPAEALDALRFSTLLAAYAPEQTWWRLELWLRLFAASNTQADDLVTIRRQLAWAFASDPHHLAILAAHYDLRAWVRVQLLEAGTEAAALAHEFPPTAPTPSARP